MNKEKDKNLKLTEIWHIFLIVAVPVICVSGITIFPFKLRLPLIYLIGILSLLIFVFSGIKVKLNTINVAMFMLLVFIAIQLLYSYDPATTLKLLKVYACAFTLLFIDIPQNIIHKIITVMYVICIVIAVSIIISLPIQNCMLTYFKFIVNPLNSTVVQEAIIKELGMGSYSGFARERGEAAFIMNIGLAIVFSSYFSSGKLCKKDTISLVIFLSALILTGKRTMFTIPVICFAVFMTVSKIKNKFLKTSSVVIIAIIALFFILMFMPDFANVFYRFMDQESMESFGNRDAIWKYMKIMISQYWLFGAGFGSFNNFAYDNGLRVNKEKWMYHGHNSYYQAYCELGIIGGCLFIVFIVFALFTTFKYIKSDNFDKSQRSILFFALYIQLMITVYAVTGNPIYTNQMIFSLFFAIGIVLCIGNKNAKYSNKLPTGV